MLKVALGGLHKDPLGGKEDRKDAKIGSMRKGSSALEKGHFKRIKQCLAPRGATVLTEGMRSLSRGIESSSVYESW